MRTCDSILDRPTFVPPCYPLVTHRDGALVSEQAPAHFGEELTAWAVGLGEPSNQGSESPVVGALIDGVTTAFRFCAPQAEPPPSGTPEVRYAGLADSDVGLYQINFTAPGDASADSSCDSQPPLFSRAVAAFARVLDGAVDSYDVVQLPFAQ